MRAESVIKDQLEMADAEVDVARELAVGVEQSRVLGACPLGAHFERAEGGPLGLDALSEPVAFGAGGSLVA